jgi:hypothetical protein
MTQAASNDDNAAIRELALKLSGVCAIARREHELSFGQLYHALSLAMRDVVRSCDCSDCRKRVLRHVRTQLPKEVGTAAEEAIDKYLGVVGHC